MRNTAGIVNTSGSSSSWSLGCSIFMKKRGEKVFSESGLGPALAQCAVDLISFISKPDLECCRGILV